MSSCGGGSSSTNPPPDQTPTAASPTFSPPPGIYVKAQDVTIETATIGGILLYTIDNTEPTHDINGNPIGTTLNYSMPVHVTSSVIIKAITYISSMDVLRLRLHRTPLPPVRQFKQHMILMNLMAPVFHQNRL